MKAYVYLITCKETGHLYVGKSLDPSERFRNHLSSAEKGVTPLYRAILKYGKSSFILSILEECDSEELAYLAESKWIKNFREQKKFLYNLNDGGEGNFSPCDETRKRMSAAQKGKLISQETREKISCSLKGTKLSQETLTKISNSLKGQKRTGQQLENLRLAAQKRSADPDWKRKNKEALQKTIKDPDVRKKLSIAKSSYTEEQAIEAYELYLSGEKIKKIKSRYQTSNTTMYLMLKKGAELLGHIFKIRNQKISDYQKSLKKNSF